MFSFLSKQHIRQASDFDALFKRGKRLVDGCFAFYFVKANRDYSRLGMVVSKRNCALAVNRNRIKRVTREIFRLNKHLFLGVDLVVALRSSTKRMSDQEQCECIKKLFSQLIARCDGSSLP